MSTSNAKVADTQPPANGSPAKNQYPRTRHMSDGKMLTYRNGQLLSIQKLRSPHRSNQLRRVKERLPPKKRPLRETCSKSSRSPKISKRADSFIQCLIQCTVFIYI